MRASRSALSVLLALLSMGGVVVVGVAPTASANTGVRFAFSGDVCSLLTPKQVASVNVTPLKCSTQKPIKGSGGTLYFGNWGGTGLAPHLSVSVDAHSDAAGLQQAKGSLGHFPNAKKVSGIGSVAYESSSGNPAMLNFIIGEDVVEIGLQTKQPLKSAAAFTALAKAIAGKL
jgi:hypothetical protein